MLCDDSQEVQARGVHALRARTLMADTGCCSELINAGVLPELIAFLRLDNQLRQESEGVAVHALHHLVANTALQQAAFLHPPLSTHTPQHPHPQHPPLSTHTSQHPRLSGP